MCSLSDSTGIGALGLGISIAKPHSTSGTITVTGSNCDVFFLGGGDGGCGVGLKELSCY